MRSKFVHTLQGMERLMDALDKTQNEEHFENMIDAIGVCVLDGGDHLECFSKLQGYTRIMQWVKQKS